MINAIIFDFGNVLLNLNPAATAVAFQKKLGIQYDFVECGGLNDTFRLFETGDISPQDFVTVVLDNSSKLLPEQEIVDIWNSMLLDLPAKRLDMLKVLRRKYKVFLLSNTNSIHIDYIGKYLKGAYPAYEFEKDFFDQVYYSFRMKDRKPNLSIYMTVLERENLVPHEVLFIDDNEENVLAARQLGINSILHNPEDEIVETINTYLKIH